MATIDTAAPKALQETTMCGALLRTIAERGDAVALRTPDGAVSFTFAEAGERIRAVAAALAGLGVGRGDPVGLMMSNRPEFNLIDAAAMLLGAVPFSVYNPSPAEQIGFVMGDAGNRVVVHEAQFAKLVEAARSHGADQVEHVVDLDDLVSAPAEPAFDLEQRA